ncbi:MAG TPA: EamA family transporter [Candidatus Saccharimonadales bacterium]|nr:EamA family transporter [Candidatus Saccharimonadales bacterium]
MAVYVLAAVLGSTLIKYGSMGKKVLYTVPVVHMGLSLATLFGVFAYGISFLLYIVLLSRFDLSFISPLLVAFVYVLLMFTAFLIFKEQLTLYKILGCSLILVGVVLVLMKR